MMYIPKTSARSPALEYVSASSGGRGDAKTELRQLMQRVETQLAHHHTLPTPPSPAAGEVKPGTRDEVKRLQGNFGNGSCRIHVLL